MWKAYYAAQWSEGPTKEWCMATGSNNRIVDVTVGGEHAWYMLGHVYFDKDYSETMREILERECPLSRTADKLWEDLYIEHIKELDMEIRPYEEGVINEFDSLDQLRGFDPQFIENVDTDIFDNIARVLNCARFTIGLVCDLFWLLVDEGQEVYRFNLL